MFCSCSVLPFLIMVPLDNVSTLLNYHVTKERIMGFSQNRKYMYPSFCARYCPVATVLTGILFGL